MKKAKLNKKEPFAAPGILKNSFFNGFGYIFNLLLIFFLTPFIIHRLGKDAYGLWIIVIGLTGYLGLMDFGVRSALGKYFAEYAARKDYEQINRFLNTIWSLFAVLAVIVSATGIVIVYAFIDSFKIPSELLGQARKLGYIFSIFLGLSFPLSIPLGVLSGFRRFDLLNLNSLIIRSLRAVMIIIWLRGDQPLYRLLAIHIGSGILEYSILYWICFHNYPFLKLRPFSFDIVQLRKTLRFGLNSFVIKISDTIIFYTDTLLVGRFLSTAMVAVYGPAESLIGHLRSMVITFINVTLPEASRLQSMGDFEKLRELAIKATKYLSLFVLPASAVVLVFSDEFIQLWLGQDFLVAATIMKILVLPQACGLIQHGLDSALYGIGKHHSLAKLMVVVAFSNLILSLIFLQWWGIYGVAWGTVIPLTLGQTIGSPLFSKRYFGLSIKKLIMHGIIPPLLAALVYLIVLLIIESYLPVTNYLHLITNIIIATICCLPLFFFTLDESEKAFLRLSSVRISRWALQRFSALDLRNK